MNTFTRPLAALAMIGLFGLLLVLAGPIAAAAGIVIAAAVAGVWDGLRKAWR
jgi:hypothetical protein